MKKSPRTTALAALGVTGAAVGLGLALLGSPAQAEDPAPSSSASPAPSSSASAPAKPDRAAGRAQRQDELAAALATELGVDKAKVAAALDKIEAARKAARPEGGPGRTADDRTAEERKAERVAALKTRLDAAVKAGTLTADESAAILKAAEAGVLPQGGAGRGGRPGR